MLTQYIIWNPDPIIIDFGFVALHWYSLFFTVLIVFCYWRMRKAFIEEGIAPVIFETMSIYVIFGCVIGARLGHCLFYDFAYFSQHPWEIILPVRFSPHLAITGFRGLASHGGMIGGLIAIAISYFRFREVSIWFVLDKLSLAVPLCGALIRLGNLMNSEIIGKAATVRWAFVFKQIDNVPRHPGQLYEALAYIIIFLYLKWLHKKKPMQPVGTFFGWFLVLVFTARFFIEFFKENQVGFESSMTINMGQVLSIPFILVGIFLVVWGRFRDKA